MSEQEKKLWQGLDNAARKMLTTRDYKAGSLAQQLGVGGVEAGELAAADRTKPDLKKAWIPGVEVFTRRVHAQRHRGFFGEFARRDEGILSEIGFWPAQWATARMFAGTAKGFHVHPPSIPKDSDAAEWMGKLFLKQPANYSLRPYEREQWDVIFFVQGLVEMILRDARAGLPARTMRFFIDGDDHRGRNNVGVVIPPGVAHAIRVEGSGDVIMVYGTSTSFRPEFEGRIGAEVETAELPASWKKFLGR
jgi:dTDP-4-dehydrorhamnose 3,5-epimerase-like enzyme